MNISQWREKEAPYHAALDAPSHQNSYSGNNLTNFRDPINSE
jgi:hypothetical protein